MPCFRKSEFYGFIFSSSANIVNVIRIIQCLYISNMFKKLRDGITNCILSIKITKMLWFSGKIIIFQYSIVFFFLSNNIFIYIFKLNLI